MSAPAVVDYRSSHRDSGEGYDASIASSPFDNYLATWEARYIREMIAGAFPGGIPRYLDFACGTGRITTLVAPMAREVVGVDVSESMLARAARKVPDARLVHGDVTRDDLGLGTFDLATAFRFFGNAEPELRQAALRALNGLVRPGGYLLINNHRNPGSIANLIQRLRGARNTMQLSHRTLKGLLSTNGFEIAQARPIAVWQYRGKLQATAGANPDREAKLERRFGARAWVPVAPDTVILARKVRDLTRSV